MNVNITLVMTRTWPAETRGRLGRVSVVESEETGLEELGGRSAAAIDGRFRWTVERRQAD
jgi:hypothetical protein